MFRDETNRVTLQTYKRRAYRALMIQLLNWSVTGIIGATNIEANTKVQDGSRLFGLVANQVRTVGCCHKHAVYGRSEETWPLYYTTSTTSLSLDCRRKGKNSIQRCQRHRNVRSILLASLNSWQGRLERVGSALERGEALAGMNSQGISGNDRNLLFSMRKLKKRDQESQDSGLKGEKLCLVLECLIYTWVSFCLFESFWPTPD
jgi:hypothetical protein